MGEQLEGQMSLTETLNMNLSTEHYIVQANDLVMGQQSLELNEAKLIRLAIMQIKKDDKEFKPYCVRVVELANLLNISSDNIYRDIEKMCKNIISNPVEIKKIHKGKVKWVAIPWVKLCAYDTGKGVIYIKLNEELAPYLLDLKDCYTQYYGENIIYVKSKYAIRIFELIHKSHNHKFLPKGGVKVVISFEDIRNACKCHNKYKKINDFKVNVIEKSIQEIEKVTLYKISSDYIKEGRKTVAVEFSIGMAYK